MYSTDTPAFGDIYASSVSAQDCCLLGRLVRFVPGGDTYSEFSGNQQ